MAKRITKPIKSVRLKERIENFLNSNLTAIKKIPPADIRNLFEDLQIYQTEIENHSKEIQKGEYRFRKFLNDLDDIAYEADSSGNITYANKMSEKITGLPLKNIIGKSFLPLFVEESQKIAIDVYQKTLHGKNPEYDLTFTNGKICRFKNKPLRDKDNKIIGVFGIARDITEQKLTEKKYRILADNVTDAIFIVSIDNFGFEYVSPSVASVFGYTVEEFGNLNINDFLIPDSADHAMKVLAQEIEKDKYGKAEPQVLDLEVVRKDGSNIWIGLSARFLRDNKGHVTSVLCVARDISKRKKTEEELRIEKDRSQHYLDIAGVMFIAIDTEQNVMMINKKGCNILGYEEHEIVGKNWFDHFIKVENIDSIKGVFDQAISGNIEPAKYYENAILRKNGEGRIIAWHNSIIRDDSGRIIGTLSSGDDITERRQAEEALQKSEKMHRLLAENARDTIFRQSLPDGGFEYISSAFKLLTGYTPEELYNEPLLMMREIVHPDSADCFREQWEKLLDGEMSPYYEYQVVSKSGEIKWVNQRSVLIIDNDTQSPIAIEGIISDVTELKKAGEKILQTKNSLEEKVKERTVEIEEKSIALKVLLNQRGGDKKKLEEVIMSNVKELLIPNINRLKSSTLSSKQQTALNVLESNLNEIISPFVNSVSSSYMKLTPTEIQVANFIKHGASSKDIAESLSLSQRTVDTHRYNIRKKLELSGKGSNLRTYLMSLG